MAENNIKAQWDNYWKIAGDNFFAELYRKIFLSIPMGKMIDKYFPYEGVFCEAGSGSAGDTIYYKKRQRQMIALDISPEALKLARQRENIDKTIEADLKDLPFENESLNGIWNLGVMEHFDEKEIHIILNEMNRTLKPKGIIILLWPARYNIPNIFLSWFFPAMPTTLKSRKHGKEIIENTDFHVLQTKITIMGDIILVAQKI